MIEALMWLLEHGGDPIGFAANKTVTDPRGFAALALALLRGREEAAQLALPVTVVHQIISLVDTYTKIGTRTVWPSLWPRLWPVSSEQRSPVPSSCKRR
jgi:hypothetical protein